MFRPRRNNTSAFSKLTFFIVLGAFVFYVVNNYIPSRKVLKDSEQQLSEGSLDKHQIEKIVEQIIKEKPELIISSLEQYQVNKMKEMEAKSNAAVSENKNSLIKLDNPWIGAQGADVNIIAFIDYNCGYCKRSAKILSELLKQDNKVKVIFKDLPILGPNSEVAAKAAIAFFRLNQTNFASFHNDLIEARQTTLEEIKGIASRYGIEADKLEAEMNASEVSKIIGDNAELAKKLGVHGTPAFVVQDQFIPGYVELNELQGKVRQARNR
jgi:protein-disulfide isomerase